MNYVYLAIGLGMLVLGRKLFWLFTGGIGFFLGYTLAPQLLPGQSDTFFLTVAIIFGIIGVFLAVLVKTAAIGIAGFAAGAYILYSVIPYFNLDLGNFYWIVVIAGGILGALLASSMFDWALIFLTSASGAMIVSQSLSLKSPISLIVLLVLFILGIIIQGNIKSKD